MSSVWLPVLAQGDGRARADAEQWLALVDNGKYRDSWKEASKPFRTQVTAEEWERQVRAVRESIGSLASRKLASSKAAKTLPGAPDGDYVVMMFEAKFTKKESAIETVVVSLESGHWRVAGYFIR
ncbi:MAG: DUF4019 domain-containing protein [Acidobacteria bacterium]|nr:DUF4019 domain-containing protein [Acidobacteriota bacterium]